MRLTKEREAEIRRIEANYVKNFGGQIWVAAVRHRRELLAELDAVRADLIAAEQQRDALLVAAKLALDRNWSWNTHDELKRIDTVLRAAIAKAEGKAP